MGVRDTFLIVNITNEVGRYARKLFGVFLIFRTLKRCNPPPQTHSEVTSKEPKVREIFAVRNVDCVMVKGKSLGVNICEVICRHARVLTC